MLRSYSRILPWSPLTLDVNPSVAAAAAKFCAGVGLDERARLERQVEAVWGEPAAEGEDDRTDAVVALSCRTLLDLYLRARDFSRGSQVLCSAVNIPGVCAVVRAHGLVPVPVDLDLATLAPLPEAAARLATTRTVAYLVAHVYGRRFDAGPAADLCERLGIDLVEDCAEAFSGAAGGYRGHPRAVVSFFSFGPIKHATAFGGGLARVRDAALRLRMRAANAAYPVQTRGEYARKVARYLSAAAVLNTPAAVRAGTWLARDALRGVDYARVKERAVAQVRGFSGEADGDELVRRLRLRPCDALLALLLRRLRTSTVREYDEFRDRVAAVVPLLPRGAVVPGLACEEPRFWLFPVLVADPEAAARFLASRGVDTYRGVTQLDVVPVPSADDLAPAAPLADGSGCELAACPMPESAARLIRDCLYLPMHRQMPPADLRRVAREMRAAAKAGAGVMSSSL